MRTSLGLEGDLDDVELVEDIEQAFGVHLPDSELSQCHTVGDLFELVLARLPDRRDVQARCATAMCFYRLRRTIRSLAPGVLLKPSAPINLLQGLPIRSFYKAMQAKEGLRPPPPYISCWGGLSLLFAVSVPVGLRLLDAPWWLAGAALVLGVVLYRLSPTRLPPRVRTVRDFVEIVSARNIGMLSDQGARLRPADAWKALKTMCSDHAETIGEEIGRETLIYTPHPVKP